MLGGGYFLVLEHVNRVVAVVFPVSYLEVAVTKRLIDEQILQESFEYLRQPHPLVRYTLVSVLH